ncbi:hypothetical protein FRC05_001135 [Tulasnella sp. 425]|nr:hypothetical protein FRC05_001135 [Tulasnella sp. 425]
MVFAFTFVVSAAILILLAYQASLFLTNGIDKGWIIFGIVVSSLAIISALLLSMQYDFRTHIAIIAILCILWLAFAAYTTDRVGYFSCESLDGTTRPTSPPHSPYDAVSWCRQTKAVQGLSWFNFALMLIAVISWVRLNEEEERFGFRDEDSASDRAPYRAAEVVGHMQEDGIRRRAFGQYATDDMPVPPQVLTSTGYNTGVPTSYYPAQAPIYQQPGQPLYVQGGQIVSQPVY